VGRDLRRQVRRGAPAVGRGGGRARLVQRGAQERAGACGRAGCEGSARVSAVLGLAVGGERKGGGCYRFWRMVGGRHVMLGGGRLARRRIRRRQSMVVGFWIVDL
jgi:hypothetical protein